jgi:hypothetical protein
MKYMNSRLGHASLWFSVTPSRNTVPMSAPHVSSIEALVRYLTHEDDALLDPPGSHAGPHGVLVLTAPLNDEGDRRNPGHRVDEFIDGPADHQPALVESYHRVFRQARVGA